MRNGIIFAFIAVSLFSIGIGSNAYSQMIQNSSSEDSATVFSNSKVTLSGLKSTDPQDFPLKYQWAQVSGEPVSIPSLTAPEITFTTPLVDAGETKTLTFSLTVDNSHSGKSTTTFTLGVVHNDPPVVTTVHSITVPPLSLVTLSGSGYDPEGGPVAFTWSQTSGDNVLLSAPNQQDTKFIAPAVPLGHSKTMSFLLTGVDNQGLQGSDTETVLVWNYAPVTVSCPDIQKAMPGTQVTISPQIDNPHNADITYGWTQGSGDKIFNLQTDQKDLTFTVPEKVHGYELSFKFNVYEANIPVANCESYIYFSYIGDYPITDTGPAKTTEWTKANAGLDESVPELTSVSLDGSHSVGKNLRYSWTQTGGDPVELLNSNTPYPSFIAPSVDKGQIKDLAFTLTVSNGSVQDSDSVHIKVYNPLQPPTARITLK